MTDAISLNNMLSSELNVTNPDSDYARVVWKTLADKNQKVFTGGRIVFETDSLGMKDLIIYRDSLLEIPMSITTSATAYTAATRLAIKTSLLSLIQGIFIQAMSGGDTIVTELNGGTNIMANLRLILETSMDFIKAEGPRLHYFGLDSNLTESNSGIESSVTTMPTVATILDATINKALLNRVTILETKHSSGTATKYVMIARIPLRFIHPFFDVMDFPIDNWPLKIEFLISGLIGNNYQAWTAPTYPPQLRVTEQIITSATAAAPCVVTTPALHGLAVGDSFRFVSGGTNGVCPTNANGDVVFDQRLYVTAVPSTTTFTFSTDGGVVPFTATVAAVLPVFIQEYKTVANNLVAPSAPHMTDALQNGFTVSEVQYKPSTCNLILKHVTLNSAALHKLQAKKEEKEGFKTVIQYNVIENFSKLSQTGPQFDITVNGKVTCPQRLFVMCPAVTQGVPHTTSMNNVFPSWIGTNVLYNTQLWISGDGLFANGPIKSQQEFYQMLLEESIGSGDSNTDAAAFDYHTFRNGWNPYVFPMKRLLNLDPNKQVELRLTSQIGIPSTDVNLDTMADPSAFYDLIILCEKKKTLILHRDNKAVTHVAKDGVYSA